MTTIKDKTHLFYLLVENDNVTVINYIKRDKTSRDVNCTLNFNKILTDDFSTIKNIDDVKSILNNGKMIAIYDNDKKDWRHLLLKNIKDLKINDEVYKVSLD